MRILITGITGFVAPHLAQHISVVAPDAEVWGLVWGSDDAETPSTVHPIEGDLTDRGTMPLNNPLM